jgi:acylphosphatase
MDNKKRVNLLISGKVQGVFFRASVKKEAQKIGLTGWVRNLNDGKVELVAEGEENCLVELIEWSKKGSAWSSVKNVQIDWQDHKGEFESFRIKY